MVLEMGSLTSIIMEFTGNASSQAQAQHQGVKNLGQGSVICLTSAAGDSDPHT